jgi:hypothetical protein
MGKPGGVGRRAEPGTRTRLDKRIGTGKEIATGRRFGTSKRTGASKRTGRVEAAGGVPTRAGTGGAAAKPKGQPPRTPTGQGSRSRAEQAGPPAPGRLRRSEREKGEPAPRRPGWGSVAVHGAQVVTEPPGRPLDRAPRSAQSARPRPEPEQWVEEPTRSIAGADPSRRARATRRAATLPEGVVAELTSALGPARAASLQKRLAQAVEAYEADRYDEALRILKPLAKTAPSAPAVRELHGLTLYRLGRWSGAIQELDAFRELTGSLDQHPVLADCHRALGHWSAVEELWDELRQASPSAALVTEGRIVAAGALADRGDVQGAIRSLERAATRRSRPKRPKLHHLRLWYALADFYERAGDIPRARELFDAVLDHDPDFVDARRRREPLG